MALIFCFSLILNAQEKNEIKPHSKIILHNFNNSVAFQLKAINYCMQKFHKKQNSSYIFTYGGLIAATSIIFLIPKPTAPIIPSNYNPNYYPNYTTQLNNYNSDIRIYKNEIVAVGIIGSCLVITGIILNIDSYKWIDKFSFSPFPFGISAKISIK
jgi:hypothetical protein